MSNSSFGTIDKTLSDATTLGLSGLGSDGNEGVLRIPQSSSITRASLSDCLMSYPGHSFDVGVLLHCRDAVGVFYSPSQLGHRTLVGRALPLGRNAVSVFCNPSRLSHRTLVGGVLLLCGEAGGVFYSPSQLDHRTLVGRVLPLGRNAVSVFCNPSRLSHRTLVGGVLLLCREAGGVFYSPS